jgi:tRNA-Thr(GGU) m(6)t(6)A37 methyltransferase TsaA
MPFTVEPVAFVRAGRNEVVDDFWGGVQSIIELAPGFPAESLDGIEAFSHAEILFLFDRLPAAELVANARPPRGNLAWPKVGVFAQRAKARPNRIGATIVRIVSRDGGQLVVEGLDAIDRTPVIDIKPVFAEFLPAGEIRQPQWSRELMRDYWRHRDHPG